MSRAIIFAVLLIFAGMAVYKFLQPSPVTAALSPDAKFRAIAQSGAAMAEELGPLCENYPNLAAKYLKDLPLKLTGTVQRLFVSGMGSRRAGVEVYRGEKRSLMVVYDLDHYAVMQLSTFSNRGWHFVVVGTELLLVDPIKRRRSNLFYTKTPYDAQVVFSRVTPSSVILDAPRPPTARWQSD